MSIRLFRTKKREARNSFELPWSVWNEFKTWLLRFDRKRVEFVAQLIEEVIRNSFQV